LYLKLKRRRTENEEEGNEEGDRTQEKLQRKRHRPFPLHPDQGEINFHWDEGGRPRELGSGGRRLALLKVEIYI